MRGRARSERCGPLEAAGRAMIVCATSLCLLVPWSVTATASGYNDSGYSYGDPHGAGNTGSYVRDAEGGSQIRSEMGPHGGYSLTTTKCKDCHAVHRAAADDGQLLLRGPNRWASCDYCHVGGGGSKTNIQMDNDYGLQGVIPVATRGKGTGHTLGYSGRAPADIEPAYTSPEGLACFDCHTPHAAAKRVLTTFADPGRAVEATTVVRSVSKSGDPAYDHASDGWGDHDLASAPDDALYWGISPREGNIIINEAGDGPRVQSVPVWPTGRFLLIKDPHVEIVSGAYVPDTVVSDVASQGANKLAIDWLEPQGGWGVSLPDQDAAVPQPGVAGHPWPEGLLAVSEMCTDCHDGTPGASTQVARVWLPSPDNDDQGQYVDAVGHDSQPRSGHEQMPISPGGTWGNPGDPADGTDDNFGPTCRYCHVGGGTCAQCHGPGGVGASLNVYDATPLATGTAYEPVASVRTIGVSGLGSQCIDGGFSYPHRTVGKDLLKDQLFGVYFDGSLVAPGDVRDAVGTSAAAVAASFGLTEGEYFGSDESSSTDVDSVAGKRAHALDSVCLDCHGDATYWDPVATVTAYGWELILKGLP